jgi:hypothetical protein
VTARSGSLLATRRGELLLLGARHQRAFGYRRGVRGPDGGDLGIGLVVSNADVGNPGPFISLAHERLREIVELNVITRLDPGHHQRTLGRGPLVNDKRENLMKFLLQVRFNGADAVIGELPAQEQQKVTAEFEAVRRSPGVLDGNQLQAAGTAATVRTDGEQARVTNGPAVEAGNELDGYYVYDAPDLDAATAFAARIPVTRFGATVEVRPMVER